MTVGFPVARTHADFFLALGYDSELPVVFGFAYLTATTEGVATKVGDDNIVAGPYIINNVFNSKVPAPAAPQYASAE